MRKSVALLRIYDLLKQAEVLSINYLQKLIGCSERTCHRYMHDIRYYLNTELDLNLVYDRKAKTYKIVEL